MDQEWGKKGLLPGVLGGQQGPTKAMLVVGGTCKNQTQGLERASMHPTPLGLVLMFY